MTWPSSLFKEIFLVSTQYYFQRVIFQVRSDLISDLFVCIVFIVEEFHFRAWWFSFFIKSKWHVCFQIFYPFVGFIYLFLIIDFCPYTFFNSFYEFWTSVKSWEFKWKCWSTNNRLFYFFNSFFLFFVLFSLSFHVFIMSLFAILKESWQKVFS